MSRVQRRVLGAMAGIKMTMNPWGWMHDSHLTSLPPVRTDNHPDHPYTLGWNSYSSQHFSTLRVHPAGLFNTPGYSQRFHSGLGRGQKASTSIQVSCGCRPWSGDQTSDHCSARKWTRPSVLTPHLLTVVSHEPPSLAKLVFFTC